MKLKYTLVLLTSLLFSAKFYSQEEDINLYLAKFQTTKKKDTSALNLLRTDTSFTYKFISSNRETDNQMDCFRYQYRFPENEKADSVIIEFSTFSKTEDDHHPTFIYFYPGEKNKLADTKFNELDGKVSKTSTGRSPITAGNKKTISYRLPGKPGAGAASANLSLKTVEDADGNKATCVSLSIIN
jgi:hypothetical protein